MSEQDKLKSLEKGLQNYPPVLTPDQVADILGVSRRTVDDYIKADVIKAFPLDPSKARKQYRVTKAELMAYVTNKGN